MKVKDLVLACTNIQPGATIMIISDTGKEKYEDYLDIINDTELCEEQVLFFDVKSEMKTTYIYL